MSKLNTVILFDIKSVLNKISIKERQRVAEFGCGNYGYFVFPLAKLVGPNGQVFAVDILRTALETVKKRALVENFRQIETIWSNLEIFKGTNIESSSLDQVLIINTLNQSKKKVEILREAVRLLKTGGKLSIVEWKNTDSPLGPKLESRVDKNSLKKIAPRLGLSFDDEFEAGPFHYGLIFHKL